MRKSDLMPVLLALLLAGLCLTNLSGCAEKGETVPTVPDVAQNEPAVVPDPEPETVPQPVEPAVPDSGDPADGPLTEEELKFFNEEFFNGDYMNIRNQFLSSVYEIPADIDLFELFYCGSGRDETITDEEWAAFETASGCQIDTDITKVSIANINAVLMEYTGLALEETNRVRWGNFTLMPEYGAYYLAHGDTNYRSQVNIAAGIREGDLVHLYYDNTGWYYVVLRHTEESTYYDNFYCDGWMCVTLRERGDGGYQFVSNMQCGESDVPNI